MGDTPKKRVYKRKPRKCRGIVMYEDPRERPLKRCSEPRDRGEYCEYHASQKERQDALRRYLKLGWDKALVAARGRPVEPDVELPSVEEAQRALAPAPAPAPAQDAEEEPDNDLDLFNQKDRAAFLRGDG